MYVGCYVCGNTTSDDILSITPYGLLPICCDECLKVACNADTMPPRMKRLYDQQQRRLEKEK